MTKRKKRWIIALGSLVVVIMAGAVLLSHWLQASSTGSVRVGRPTPQPTQTPESLRIMNRYFGTELPAGFNLKRQAISDSPDSLLNLVATTSSSQDEQFAVTIGALPAGGLAGLSDYNLRVTKPADYTSYIVAGLPAGAVAFRTVNSPAAFTVFWPHGTEYAEIALSTDSAATLEQLNTVFEHAKSNWKWF